MTIIYQAKMHLNERCEVCNILVNKSEELFYVWHKSAGELMHMLSICGNCSEVTIESAYGAYFDVGKPAGIQLREFLILHEPAYANLLPPWNK